MTAAPRNGTNIGALASMPSRRSWMTCPISCTSSSSTKPTANFQPQMSAYAAIDTSIVADVVSTFAFGSTSRAALPNFKTSSPTTTTVSYTHLRAHET